MENPSYGKTITNQMKHLNVEYCSGTEANCEVNTQLFQKLYKINAGTYEVQFCKKKITINLPVLVSFFVHQIC